MADLAEDPLSPDWGQIDKGNPKAVSDALFTIWQLIHPSPVSLSQLSLDSQVIFNSQGNLVGDTNFKYLPAVGGVGIGPINPVTGQLLYLSSNNGNARQLVIDVATDTANYQPRWAFRRSRGTVSPLSRSAVQNGDLLGLIDWAGWDGASFISAAYIDCFVDGTPGSADMPGALRFFTTPDGASTPVEHLRITPAGDLITGSGLIFGGTGGLLFGPNTVDGSDSQKLVLAGGPPNDVGQYRGAYMQINGNEAGAAGFFLMLIGNVAGAKFVVYDSGGSSALEILGSTAKFKMQAYGAGTATFDASGNLTSVSDERLKDIQGLFFAGLGELLGVRPIRYRYRREAGLDTENIYVGFSAQNVMASIPEAVGKGSDGMYTISDRPILAAVVNAVQTLEAEIRNLRAAQGLPPIDHPSIRHTGEERIVRSRPRDTRPPLA